MAEQDLIDRRLRHQQLIRSSCRTPAEVVHQLGAMQAQDFAGAVWAIGQRALGLHAGDVIRAYDQGAILRTHVLRPTWHFVTPADIRWILALSGPRVHVANGSVYRKCELDTRLLSRCHATFERALGEGRHLTRAELAAALHRARITATGLRLAYMVIHAELEGLLCSGTMRGKQFTYALLDQRAPRVPAVAADEGLARLTRRYFTSHGPATSRDFAWWSGLTMRQVTRGLEMNRPDVSSQSLDGRVYWSVRAASGPRIVKPSVFLLPNYDECLIAYKDRQLAFDPASRVREWKPTYFAHQLVIDGRVRGSWARTLEARRVLVQVKPFRPLAPRETRGLLRAVSRYGRFLNLEAELRLETR